MSMLEWLVGLGSLSILLGLLGVSIAMMLSVLSEYDPERTDDWRYKV